MEKVILDENLPIALRHHLAEFDVVTVHYQGWAGTRNGELISLIDGNFDVFVTADQNLRYQQNLLHRAITIIEVPSIRRSSIPHYIEQIRSAILNSTPGDYVRIHFQGR